jgi:hypothetical protein
MVFTILKIRIVQVFRVIKLIGLIRALILLILVGFGAMLIVNFLKQESNSIIAPLAAGLIILSIHAFRKDKRFLKMYFKNCYFIFLVEYFILVSPLLLVLMALQSWKNVVLISLLCITIPRIFLNLGMGNGSTVMRLLLSPFSSNFNFRLNIKIPIKNPKAFELISGFRRHFIVFIPVYLVVLTFSYKGYVAPIGMVILAVFISGFYFYGESREFIVLFSQNYKTFIFEKIKLNLRYMFVLFSPIIIISLALQPETWYFIAGAVILSAIIQVITIIIKYALFIENSDLGHNGILVFFNVVCILLPFLWPLPVVMCIRYYKKAQHKLKIYFDDID